MFKFKYNFLAFFQVMISLLNYFLLMKVFGVSEYTDAYLLLSAILGALLLLQMLTTEQFLFFYNDIKAKETQDAYNFYGVALSVSILTAVVTFMVTYFGNSYIIHFFISSSDLARFHLMESFFYIAMFELLTAPIYMINQKLLNAEMYFSVPYILNIIPTLFVFMSIVYLYYFEIEDIRFLIYARVIGLFLTLFISFFIIKKIHIPIKLSLSHPKLKDFVKNSLTMRFGHNIHNFLFTPITTNILTSLPSGYASYFYYAMKIAGIINSIVIGPSAKVFQSKFSSLWSAKHFSNAKHLIVKYLLITVPLILISSIVGYFILPYLLTILTDKLTIENIKTIQYIFAGLMVWYIIVLIESGSVSILVAEKKSHIFIYTNLIFVLMYYGFTNYFLDKFSIYSILYALIVSQVVNFLLYTYFGQKILIQRLKQNES